MRPPGSAYALRVRVVLAVLVAALLPQGLVLAWSQVERAVPSRLWRDTAAAMEASASAAHTADGAALAEAIASVARAHHARVRVLGAMGETLVDVDEDTAADGWHPVERFLFGAVARSARELDESLPPPVLRDEIALAREHGRFVGCETTGAVICQGAVAVAPVGLMVHVQRSSLRAVGPVYALRARLLRLTILTLPLSVLLALWATARFMRPLAALRDRALVKARAASRAADLPASDDEVGDVAQALNALLDALDARRSEKERFVADLVHQMKSPVAAVRVAAELLAKDAASDRDARLGRALDQSSRKLDDLVSHFLELAKVEAGLSEEPRRPVDLAELARAVASDVARDPRYARVTFDHECARPVIVEGVAARLEAMVRELVDNAASFVDAASGRVRVTVSEEGGSAELRVEDDGPGIAASDLPRVFDRFFTTRGPMRGTGLGLALVKAVAEAHGGSVAARSGDQGGAVLAVTLPLAAR